MWNPLLKIALTSENQSMDLGQNDWRRIDGRVKMMPHGDSQLASQKIWTPTKHIKCSGGV
jgi:hypothetical protein